MVYRIYLSIFFVLIFFEGYALKPIKEYISFPSNLNIDYEEINIKNIQSNYELCSWISKPKEKVMGIIILSYGDYGNMSYFLDYIKFYTDLGYIVISYDYRGFGKSSEFPIQENFLFYPEFIEDLKTVISFAKEKYPNDEIGLVSLSMGTVIAATTVQDEKIDFMINESTVYNIHEIVSRLKNLKGKDIVIPSDINLFDLWSKIDTKMLFISGKEDVITTTEDAELIVNQHSSNRSNLIHNGNHVGFLRSENNDDNYFVNKIKSFLNNGK